MFDQTTDLERPVANGQRERQGTASAVLNPIDYSTGFMHNPSLWWTVRGAEDVNLFGSGSSRIH